MRDPRDRSFDAFRAHYPSCAECSAELRALTQALASVEEGAAAVHPSPEELECYEREPAALAPDRSDFIANHLRHCASCADELGALRGYRPEAIAAAARATPARSPWRRIFWNPAFALIAIGVVGFPVLYRSLGPSYQESAAPSAPLAKQERAVQSVADRDRALAAREVEESGASTPAATTPRPASPATPIAPSGAAAETMPRDNSALGSALNQGRLRDSTPPGDLPRAQREFDAGLRTPATAPPAPALAAPDAKMQKRSAAAPARPGEAAAVEGLASDPAPVTRDIARSEDPRRAEFADAADAAVVAEGASAPVLAEEDAGPRALAETERAKKVDDPLAHHVFIPTMRLRPGQVSWGPASELGNGFFLEIPLPRGLDAGRAEVLIIPDGSRKQARRREALTAETRALDALAGRADSNDGEPREFQERIPVEAKQRSLMLQVPGGLLGPDRYGVELEIYRDDGGDVQGRGRFRLEILDE